MFDDREKNGSNPEETINTGSEQPHSDNGETTASRTEDGRQNESRDGNNGWQNESRDGNSGWQNESRDRNGGWQNESWGTGGSTQRSSYQYQNQETGTPAEGGRHRGGQKKKMSSGVKVGIAAGLLLLFCVICSILSFVAVNTVQGVSGQSEEAMLPEASDGAEETGKAAEEQTPDTQEGQIAEQGEIKHSDTQTITAVVTDVTEVVEEVMPSAVSITNQMITVANFWGQDVEQETVGRGSGIIIGQNDEELLIVTNYHVVQDSTKLYVQFVDNESVEAQLKGSSSSMDLAVIAVRKEDLKDSTKESICIAKMGDSDSLKIGEPAIAIGNALGYGQSVTTGVISALNRTLEVSETGTNNSLIQTDAAINPGNSGGALLNIKGEVIGINTNKIGGTTIEGMGYAIPISSAKPIIEELMLQETRAKVTDEERGYLGITCINVTKEVSEAYNMPVGIFVAQVYPDTGAEKAGLTKGDIITKFDGNTVSNQEDLTNCMQYYEAGETVTLTIMRGTPSGYTEMEIQMELCSLADMNDLELNP